jgi:hypothetical protein
MKRISAFRVPRNSAGPHAADDRRVRYTPRVPASAIDAALIFELTDRVPAGAYGCVALRGLGGNRQLRQCLGNGAHAVRPVVTASGEKRRGTPPMRWPWTR